MSGGKIRGEQIKDNSITGEDVDEGTFRVPVRDVNSSQTLNNDDYIVRCISGGITLTLPGRANSRGQVIVIKDALYNAASSNIVIDGSGSETIDGLASYTMSSNGECATLVCDGVNGWMVISTFGGAP